MLKRKTKVIMQEWKPIVFILLYLGPTMVTSSCPRGYYIHRVSNSTLPVLCCPESQCNLDETHRIYLPTCCDCHGIPEYIANHIPTESLTVEYISVRGQGHIVPQVKDILSPRIAQFFKSRLFKLVHSNGFLRAIPDNICNFPDIVYVDFSFNKIKRLRNLKCLIHLDTLELSGNEIEVITNDTFLGLRSLRELHLEKNKIRLLSPYGVGGNGLTMLKVTLDGNEMTSLDASNFVLQREFCQLSYKQTPITSITNVVGITLNVKDNFGSGGHVNLQGIALQHFPDLASLGIQDIVSLGSLFPFGFDIRNCNITCDCLVEPFVSLALELTRKIWRDYFNVTCYNPAELRGQSILALVNENPDVFVCNVTTQSGCPFGCHCYRQPSRDRVVVDCANKNLKKLPLRMPNVSVDAANLEIHLTGNQITALEPRDYLNHTSLLDIANNSLESISPEVFNSFANNPMLNLDNNPIGKSIPKHIQNFDPCRLNFGSFMEIDCNCDNLWVGDWVRNKKVGDCQSILNKSRNIQCRTADNRLVPAQYVDEVFLQCYSKNPLYILGGGLLGTVLAIISGCLLCHAYKTELFLLYRSSLKFKVQQQWQYDIFVTWSDQDNYLVSWAIKQFIPKLEGLGYTIKTPGRDFMLGVVEAEQLRETMQKCRDVIIILSEALLNCKQNKTLETAWKFYVDKQIRHFIIVNYDLLRFNEMKLNYLRALFKLKLMVDFSDKEKKFYKNLKMKLGTPLPPVLRNHYPAAISRNLHLGRLDVFMEDLLFT